MSSFARPGTPAVDLQLEREDHLDHVTGRQPDLVVLPELEELDHGPRALADIQLVGDVRHGHRRVAPHDLDQTLDRPQVGRLVLGEIAITTGRRLSTRRQLLVLPACLPGFLYYFTCTFHLTLSLPSRYVYLTRVRPLD